MLNGIGPTGFVLIILVALLLFGPNKLPELGRAFGRTLKEFKEGAKDVMADDVKNVRKEIREEEGRVQASQAQAPVSPANPSADTRKLPD